MRNKRVFSILGWIAYWGVAVIFTLMAFVMSFISDGPIPLYIHILLPVVIIAVFGLVPLLWRMTQSKRIASPLPPSLRAHQDKIIVTFFILWAAALTIGYFLQHHNS